MDWIFLLGLAFVIVVFVTILVNMINGLKGGFLKTLTNFGVSAGSLTISFFLAKFVLWLGDKMFSASTAYFDVFMKAFAKIPIMNELIDSSTFANKVVTFSETEVNMSSWLKNYLLKIYDNTQLYAGETTNLATIGANGISYVLTTLLVMVTLFLTIQTVANIFIKKYAKFEDAGTTTSSKLGGAFFGILTGVLYCFMGMAIAGLVPIGADNTVIADSLKKTIVLQAPFEFTQNITIDYYSTHTNWTERNKNFTSLGDNNVGIYTNSTFDEKEKFLVSVEITYGNYLKEKTYDTSNLTTETKEYICLFANGKLWEYDTTGRNFVKEIGLNRAQKVIYYHNKIDDNGSEINYSKTLSKKKNVLINGNYSLENDDSLSLNVMTDKINIYGLNYFDLHGDYYYEKFGQVYYAYHKNATKSLLFRFDEKTGELYIFKFNTEEVNYKFVLSE